MKHRNWGVSGKKCIGGNPGWKMGEKIGNCTIIDAMKIPKKEKKKEKKLKKKKRK